MRKLQVAGVLAPLSLCALGCGDEVGPCDDVRRGQDTVLVNGSSLQYGGQAILNQSCAQGCHSSLAKGAARNGAPASLDFDLRPVDPEGDEAEGTVESGDAGTVVKLKGEAASALRERQRRIFEDRDRIWQQVKEGLMPPSGAFESFKSALKNILDTSETSPCTAGKPLEAITEKSSQDVLRNWLACGAPIIESTSEAVTTLAAPGSAGFQYPACEPSAGDGGTGDGGGAGGTITIEQVHARIFEQCTTCHSPEGSIQPDMETPDKAYQVLVADMTAQCNGKPFVTKGDPTKSFLYDLVALDTPGCRIARMPQGAELTASEIKLISDWIKGGALREADVGKSANPLQGGLDAGAR